MFPAIKEIFHDFLFNKEFFRTRVRAIIIALGTAATALVASGQLDAYLGVKWAPVVLGFSAMVSSAIGQGEKNKG